jgi:two-component system sensor histidine kinase UhpB
VKKTQCIIFFFISVRLLFSQNSGSKIDSLKHLLLPASKDTIQVNLLNKISFEYIFKMEYDLALPYAKDANKMAKEISDNKGLAFSYNAMGVIYRNKGDHKTALKNFFLGIEICEKTENRTSLGSLYSNTGRVYENLGDYPRALEYFYRALRIFQSFNDKSRTANVLRGIGKIYLLQKDQKARYCFFESFKLYQEIQVYDGIAGALNDIGEFYAQQGNQTKALDYYYQSLKASEKASYETEKASSHNNLGLIYADQHKYAKALEHFLISLELYQRSNNNNEQSRVYHNIGELEFDHNSFTKALEYYQLSLEKALLAGVLQRELNAHEGLSKVYEMLGQPANALMHYKSFIKVKEQIFNDENTKKLIRAELDYELDMKEQELKFEQAKVQSKLKQGRIQSYFLIVSIAFILLLGLFLFQRLTLRQKLKVSKLRNKIAIDLHDEVGSALSSISMYTGITQINKEAKLNEEILDKIGKTSRETIENMSDIVWSIQPKYDNFKHVLDKMEHFGNHIMIGAGIQFKFSYDEGIQHLVLDMEKRKNLYLIYKEALNNAAKYSKAKNVYANLVKKKKWVVLTIHDDGNGFDIASANGNGLQNMKERAQALKGRFDLVSERSKGTSIFLSFKIS